MTADATALYNAGTAALATGRIGEATAFLLAARRVDPRAGDVRRNLAIAERTLSVARGESAPPVPSGPAFALSTAEGWWLAALLLAVGTVAGIAAIVRYGSGALPVPGAARVTQWLRRGAVLTLLLGAIAAAALTVAAVNERRHPEAVVVAMSVEARRGVDEAPRQPILLRAGERVRTGRTHGDEVEVRIGGSSIGWVPRSALWYVSDTPRYTAAFRSTSR